MGRPNLSEPENLKVLVVMGTRPEVIKLAPVIEALKKENLRRREQPRRGKATGRKPIFFKTIICLTGQHREMVEPFLKLFGIKPDYDLKVMEPNQHLAELAGRVLTGIKKILEKEKPDWVLVQGDTTSAMAAALSAFYAGVRVGHVEAGLRTEDKRNPFPEEINRRMISHLADLHFAPTERARQNLLKEGINKESIFITGNTVVDALKMILKKKEPLEWRKEIKRIGGGKGSGGSGGSDEIERKEGIDEIEGFKGMEGIEGIERIEEIEARERRLGWGGNRAGKNAKKENQRKRSFGEKTGSKFEKIEKIIKERNDKSENIFKVVAGFGNKASGEEAEFSKFTSGEITGGEITSGEITKGEINYGEINRWKIMQGENVREKDIRREMIRRENVRGEITYGGIVRGEITRGEITQNDKKTKLVGRGGVKTSGKKSKLILVTAHRRESFGRGLEEICRAIREVVEKVPEAEVVFPVHLNPQVRQVVLRELAGRERIWLVEPVDYQIFVRMMKEASLIMTDSGGIQEEAPSLGVPVVVMREKTERPEAVEAGVTWLAGTRAERIEAVALKLLKKVEDRKFRRQLIKKNPFGDGRAAVRIVRLLKIGTP
ncbi:MAG: non-hydrolyzing UDP-N-acetylglucosamine 2-epimerase [Candidatus Saccharicenans sp.]